MYRIPTIVKKSTATLLLLVFSIVFGGKAFHSHENEQPREQGIVLGSVAGNCDLCDFHLSREGELPEVAVFIAPLACYPVHTETAPVHYISNSPAQLPGRGPPAA